MEIMELWNAIGSMSWMVLFVILLLIEILTLGLTTIWFAGGALVAFFVALFGGPGWLQLVAFFCVSIVLLVFTRPIAMKYYNNSRTKTNAESLIGQYAVVKKEINNIQATGQVSVQGMDWAARCKDEQEIIPEGTTVRILEIQGVKLIVEKEEGI